MSEIQCATCNDERVITVQNGPDDFETEACPDCGLEDDKEEEHDR